MPLLIFDLDGTLIDSRLDLAHAVNATREHMGKTPLPHDLIFTYVGNGAPVLVQRAMGPDATAEDVQVALEFFLAWYKQHALDYTVLYPGVRESIEQLSAAGMKLAVLTNKPVGITRLILDHLDLSGRMFRIYGGNSFDQKKPHPIGIDTLRTEAETSQADTWMIGDSWVDIQTARNAGVPSCGVTYGFQPESLVEYPPDVLVDRLEDFAQRFLPK
jgi:phosphoglycolate phosphatase